MSNTFLLHAQRLLQTDLQYIKKNGGWVLLGQIVIAIFGFGLTVAFANLLSQQQYGIYKFILATGGLIAVFKMSGLRLAVTQAVARGAHGTTWAALWAAARWNTFVVCISVVVSAYYFWQDNAILAIGILLVGIHSAILGAIRAYRGYLAGTEQFRTGTIQDLTTTGISTGCVLLVLLYTDNVLALVTAGIAPTLLLTSWFAWRTMRTIDRSAESSASALTFGKHVSLQNILLAVGTHIDKVILFQWLGSIELAIYAFAQLLPDYVGGLFKNVMSIAVPKFATKEKTDLRGSIRRKLWQLTAIMLIPIGIYILVAPYMFQLLFPAYLDSVWYSQILICMLVTFPALYLFTAYFDAREATGTLYIVKITNSVIKISLVLLCIWWLGILGAVLAQILSRVLQSFVLAYFYLNDNAPSI